MISIPYHITSRASTCWPSCLFLLHGQSWWDYYRSIRTLLLILFLLMYRRSQKRHEFQPISQRNVNLSLFKPREKMQTIYRHRMPMRKPQEEQLQEGVQWPSRNNSFLRRRLNKDIELQRQEFLIKTGRTSQDNPEWMTINFDHYKRSNFNSPPRQTVLQEKQYDVFNNPKRIVSGRNEDSYVLSLLNSSEMMRQEVAQRTGYGSSFRQTARQSLNEVSAKVGSLESRDYTIPRPQLKVGSQVYVDTYSPF